MTVIAQRYTQLSYVLVGNHVKRFKPGDKVVTLFNQKHIGGSLDSVSLSSGLGGAIDGTFRQYGAFDEEGLVHMPNNLNYVEAATLTCAGLTAWNALFGLEGKQLKPGQWVLTQGTGGVSLFAVQVRLNILLTCNSDPQQFAKSCGAKVVATTGSEDKAHVLKKLGVEGIINYKSTPEWGAKAKQLTGGRGFDHIVEVAGDASMAQSLASVAIDGVITIIGFVGGPGKTNKPGFMDCVSQGSLAEDDGELTLVKVVQDVHCSWGARGQQSHDGGYVSCSGSERRSVEARHRLQGILSAGSQRSVRVPAQPEACWKSLYQDRVELIRAGSCCVAGTY